MEDFWINCMIRTDKPIHITIIQKQAILTCGDPQKLDLKA